MAKKVNNILEKVLEKINPPKKDAKFIEKSVKEYTEKFKKKIDEHKIKAEIFVGGSFAKKTLIKKGKYDIDVFVRFDSSYQDDRLSELLKKILEDEKTKKIHGSRDYFRIKLKDNFYLEIVPVAKVINPQLSRNITDLSYSHVYYVQRKVKKEGILDDIKIAKSFCYANKCYGAESYIRGFSGYGLELLIYYYGGFKKFIKKMSKLNIEDKKLVIDIEKQYRGRKRVLMDMNSSKLASPIILIDPTYKQRNVLAALSNKTFKKFQKACKKFLKNPKMESFERKTLNFHKIKSYCNRYKFELLKIRIKTKKQEGDIAGSKLLKFYKYLGGKIKKFFEIKKKGFDYLGGKEALCYFAVKNKKEVIHKGPFEIDEKNAAAFKKKHKKTHTKNHRLYSKEKIDFTAKEFLNKWKKDKSNKKLMEDMSITDFDLEKVEKK